MELNPQKLRPFWTQLGLRIQNTIQETAPKRTGELASFWYVDQTDKGVKVTSNTRHANWVEFGTGLYGPNHDFIRPKRKPVLVWYENGRKFVAKQVKGQKPQLFVLNALKSIFPPARIKRKR